MNPRNNTCTNPNINVPTSSFDPNPNPSPFPRLLVPFIFSFWLVCIVFGLLRTRYARHLNLPTHLHLAQAAPMAALFSRQNPLLFIPGFFQNDAEGTDPLHNSAKKKSTRNFHARSDCSTGAKKNVSSQQNSRKFLTNFPSEIGLSRAAKKKQFLNLFEAYNNTGLGN